MTETPDRSSSEDRSARWFSFEPGARDRTDDEEAPVIRVVELRNHGHAGPFWDDEGHLSDDYEELQEWLGISRTVFDDAMAWNRDFVATAPAQRGPGWSARHLASQRELLRRLRREVPASIDVHGRS